MELPAPPQAVRALAAFVRERLADVSETLTPLWNRSESELARLSGEQRVVVATARQFATVITGAAAPFAPTSYARARLVRQMHASGLLTDCEARRTEAMLADVEPADTPYADVERDRIVRGGSEPTGTERPEVIDVEIIEAEIIEAATERRNSRSNERWLAATGTESRGVPRRAPRPWR